MIKERNIGIDILKFFAVLLITNSHMDSLYGDYSFLGTGGAFGDALFFFCSGFTLFKKNDKRFDNWYKRRITRIYPTVLAWALLCSAFFGSSGNMLEVVLYGGGWFVSCIMVYYILLFGIKKIFYQHLNMVFSIITCFILILFFWQEKSLDFEMYNGDIAGFLPRCFYFLFMLQGAIVGIKSIKIEQNTSVYLLKVCVSMILWYGILQTAKMVSCVELQIISLIPLLSFTYYTYLFSNSVSIKHLYQNKNIEFIIRFIGSLCLEVYLVQFILISKGPTVLVPFNVLYVFAEIIVLAFVVKILSRIILQTFREKDYDWKDAFKWY